MFKVIPHVLARGTFQNGRHVCVAFMVFVLQTAAVMLKCVFLSISINFLNSVMFKSIFISYFIGTTGS